MTHPLSWLAVAFLLAASTARAESPALAELPWAAADEYELRTIDGWTILVHGDFVRTQPELCDRTLELLRIQLYQTARVVPKGAVEKLRKIRIWVEEAHPKHPCMCYHVSPAWLRDHDMNPDKAGCVELANARNFLAWTIQQPWMVLHELAHGYHHQFLPDGHDNADVIGAYRAAMDSKKYAEVLRISGRRERHYAATNPMEYFAEASEAWFGTNDFYPYVKSELKEHDPAMHELLGKLWNP
jgi:hypothetical protein